MLPAAGGTLTANNSTTFAGAISGTSVNTTALTLAGTGTLNLTGQNTFVLGTGGLTLNMASVLYNGTLVLGNFALGAAANPVTLTAGNIQGIGSAITIPNPLTVTGGAGNLVGFTGSQNLTFTGAVTTTAAATTFSNTNSGTVTFTGVFGATNTVSMNFIGTGTTVLTGTSTMPAPFSVNGGTVSLAGANGSIAATSFTVGMGGTLQLDNTLAVLNTRFSAATAALNLNGGTFVVLGNASTPVAEVSTGGVTLGSGSVGGSFHVFVQDQRRQCVSDFRQPEPGRRHGRHDRLPGHGFGHDLGQRE